MIDTRPPADTGAGTSAPADTGAPSPAGDLAGSSGQAGQQPVTSEQYQALLAKVQDMQGSRDSLRAKMREQEAAHQQALATATAQAEQAGDLVKANEALKAQVAAYQTKAERHDEYEEAFRTHAASLRAALPEGLREIPEGLTPKAEVDWLTKLNSHLRATAPQTTPQQQPVLQQAPYAPQLPTLQGQPVSGDDKLRAILQLPERDQLTAIDQLSPDEARRMRKMIS